MSTETSLARAERLLARAERHRKAVLEDCISLRLLLAEEADYFDGKIALGLGLAVTLFDIWLPNTITEIRKREIAARLNIGTIS